LRVWRVEHPALVSRLGFAHVRDPTAPHGFDVAATVPKRRHFSTVLRTLPNVALQFLLTARAGHSAPNAAQAEALGIAHPKLQRASVIANRTTPTDVLIQPAGARSSTCFHVARAAFLLPLACGSGSGSRGVRAACRRIYLEAPGTWHLAPDPWHLAPGTWHQGAHP